MPTHAAPEFASDQDRLDAAADAAIAACGGDLRSTIRALILANEYLEFELGQCNAAVSRGFARGRRGGSGESSGTAPGGAVR
ncbi:hypothetical protein [Rhodopseudomonas palustris]